MRGQDERLAGVDLAGIAESGIGAGNTLPFGAVAVVGEGDLPERITRMNQNLSESGANCGGRGSRDDQDRARLDGLRIE